MKVLEFVTSSKTICSSQKPPASCSAAFLILDKSVGETVRVAADNLLRGQVLTCLVLQGGSANVWEVAMPHVMALGACLISRAETHHPGMIGPIVRPD